MNNGDQHIEDLFRNALGNSHQTPPKDVWNRIEKELNSANVNKLYNEKFEEDEENPPMSIWFKIQQRLWIKDFMQFNPLKINVYYTSLVAVFAGLGIFVSQQKTSVIQQYVINHSSSLKTSTNNTVTSNPISAQENIASRNQLVVKSFSTNQSETNHNIEISANKEKSTQVQPIQTQPTNELNSVFSIMGDTVICTSSNHIYLLNGLMPDGYLVLWSCSQNNATVEQLPNQKVSINFKTQGDAMLIATISKGTIKKTVQLHIKVIEPVVPKISGNSKVCEGSLQQYKVSNVQNINKMSSWGVDKNKYTVLSNGCVSIDANTVGYDTIRFTDMHLGGGCKVTVFLPITVYPKPVPDFTFTDNGNGLITFENASTCKQAPKCKLTCKWSINEQSLLGNTVNVTFNDNGVYSAILEVQNDFSCKSTTKKDVTISMQNLVVANAFSPQNEPNGFIPKGENLATYKIEVYTINNIKIWESAAIEDGKPSEGWNGTVNGQLQPKGKYIWKITATFQDGTTWKGLNIKGRYQTSGTFVLL